MYVRITRHKQILVQSPWQPMAPPTDLAAGGAPGVSPSGPALNIEQDESFQSRQLEFLAIHCNSEVLMQLRFLGNHALQTELYIGTFVLESVNGSNSGTNMYTCMYVHTYVNAEIAYVRM